MTNPVLAHASDAELANAVEENLYALFRAMATSLGGELEESAANSRHVTFPINPMYKGVWKSRMSPEETDESIDETIAWFRERNAPFFFWWTGTPTKPDDLPERLVAHGLIAYEREITPLPPGVISTHVGAPGFAADLQAMNEAALETVPPGFTVEEVRTEQDLADFEQVFIEGYGMPAPAANSWIQAGRHVGMGKTPWTMYLGRLNGEPVATNIIFNGAGVSGVYGIAVVPSVRGKGIGSAITLKPLLDARDQGYRYSVLFSSEMAVNTYQRIGFYPVDVRINRFLWRNS